MSNTTSATDLESLVVSLLGDSTSFDAIMLAAQQGVEDVTKEIERLSADATRTQNKLLAEAARITESVVTPTEQYAASLDRLDDHYLSGRISIETYTKALNELNKTLPENIAKENELNRVLSMADAIIEGVTTETEKYLKREQQLNDLLAKGLLTQEQYNRALKQIQSVLPSVIQAEKDAAAAQKALDDEIARGAQITQQMLNPEEKHAKALKELDMLLKNARIDQETYNRAVAASQQQLPAVQAAIKKEAEEFDKLNKELADAYRLQQSLLTPSEQYRKKLDEINRQHREGYIDATTHQKAIRGLNKEFSTLQPTLQQVGGQLQSIGGSLQRVGALMTVGITAPVAAAGYAIGKTFMSAEQGFADLQAAANPTAEDMEKIRVRVMELSKELKMDPDDITKAFSELIKAGVPVEEALNRSAKAAVQFSRVGGLQIEKSATIMSDALTVFGEDASKTINILSSAADASSISIPQIADAFAQVSAVAGSANQSLEDTAAAIALMGKWGVKGSDAGTSLKTMLLRLQAPANKGAEVIEQYGLQLRKANGEMRPFGELIDELNKKMGGLDQEQRDNALFDLFGQDAIRAGQIFLKAGTEGFDEMKGSMEGALTVAEKYAMILDTIQGAIVGLWAAFKRLGTAIGDALFGGAVDLVQWFTDLIDATTEWVKMNPMAVKMLAVFASIAAAIGPLVVLFGTLVAAIGGVVSAIAAIIAGGTVSLVIAGIVAQIAQAAVLFTAFSAAVAGFVYWIAGPEGIKSAWDYATAAVSDFVSKAVGFFANFSHNMQVLFKWLPDNWDMVFVDMMTISLTFFLNMSYNFGVALKTMNRLLVAFGGWLTGMFLKLFTKDFSDAVIEGVGRAINILNRFGEQTWKIIKAAFTGKKIDSAGFMEQLFADFGKGSDQVNFFDTARDIIREGVDEMHSPLKGFQSAIIDAPDFVFEQSKKMAEAVNDGAAAGLAAEQNPMETALREVTKTLTDEEKKQAKEIDKMMEKLHEEADTYGMSKAQIEVYRLTKAGATQEQIKEAQALADSIDLQDKQKKELEEATKVMEAFRKESEKIMSPLEKFNAEQKKLQEMLDKGLISADAFSHEMKKIQKELDKETKIKFTATGIDSVLADSAEFLDRFEKFQADMGVQVKAPAVVEAKPKLDPQNINAELADWADKQVEEEINIEKLLEQIAENTAPEDERGGRGEQVVVLEPAFLGREF